MNRSQTAGALMILVGGAILILLASFIVSVLLKLLELLVVSVGIALVLGGIAMLLFGRRVWRGPWNPGGQHGMYAGWTPK